MVDLSSELGTHAVRDSGFGFHVFNIMACEACGRLCEGPNGMGIIASRGQIVGMGITLVEERLPEIGACDERHGEAVCPDCWQAAQPGQGEPKPREFFDSYPMDWAAGLDLDKLRAVDDSTLRAVLAGAVRDGIALAHRHPIEEGS